MFNCCMEKLAFGQINVDKSHRHYKLPEEYNVCESFKKSIYHSPMATGVSSPT